jgi:hypothetical protein
MSVEDYRGNTRQMILKSLLEMERGVELIDEIEMNLFN